MRTDGSPATWTVVNPLPRALAHYETALLDNLRDLLESPRVSRPDIEVGGAGTLAKAVAALRALVAMWRVGRSKDATLVLWPLFGLVDLALWRVVARSRTLVVVHDPEPLRRQHGFGRAGSRLGSWGSRGHHVEVVTHTELAREALARRGIRVSHVVPHPVLDGVRRTRTSPPEVVVLVLGQYKAARDLDLLRDVARQSPEHWRLRIRGRGWPPVGGWDVADGFLDEEALEAELEQASVVLVPYKTYFQSGVAARAFERGIPVVGRRHEHLESMYGAAWPGFFDAPGELAGVVGAVVGEEPPDPGPHVAAARAAWRRALVR